MTLTFPANAGERFRQVYPPSRASVGAARHALTDFAKRIGASQTVLDAVALGVSEAVTNAVVHAYRDAAEPGEVEVGAAVACGELWVIVSDAGSGLRPRRDSPGLGLGLGLIAQVSDGLDLEHRAAGGFELRVRFAVDGSPAQGTT